MKFLIIMCLSLVQGEEVIKGYHAYVGIPEAERIRREEALPTSRVANGLDTYTGEHPFMAGLLISLTTGEASMCGGTMLNNQKVLTAAHCWYDGYYQGHSVLIVLGSVKLYSGGTRVNATSVTSHPDFNPHSFTNDIAMLELPYVAYTSDIKPILLPYDSYLNHSWFGDTAQVIGYGQTYDGESLTSEQSLHDVLVPVISKYKCRNYYGALVTDSVLCTDGSRGRGPCGGDSGGPLILRRYIYRQDMLIGVMSFGSASGCQSMRPYVHTRVTEYIAWINNHL